MSETESGDQSVDPGAGDDPGAAGDAEHADEVYVDTANLPELLLIVQSGSVDGYLTAIGIDPSVFADDTPVA
jgi:hypothetical protein